MPISKYNKAFGGKKGSAAKAKRAMAKEYGSKKGEEVFYATMNKHMKMMEHGTFSLPAGADVSAKRGAEATKVVKPFKGDGKVEKGASYFKRGR